MMTNNPIVRLETFAHNCGSPRAMALDVLLANFKNHKQVHETLCCYRGCPERSGGDDDSPTMRNVSAPAMPCLNSASDSNPDHREFNPLYSPSWPVMVARKV